MHVGHVRCGILVALLAACVNSQQQLLFCDTSRGYELLSGNKCVKVYYGADDLTWQSSQDVCRRYGSRLVTIKDQYDNDKLGDLVRIRTGRDDTSYWIGLSQTLDDTCACKEPKWETGRVITENEGYWMDDQPDDRRGDCVYAQNNTQGKFNYIYDRPIAWSFDKCTVKRSFVCEKDAAPLGSFHCFTEGYVRADLDVCNNVADCSDGSDELNCPQYCRYYYDGEGGSLDSLLNNADGQTCTWAIMTPLGSNAYVELRNFQTQDVDSVSIFTGSIIETQATRVGRISGSITQAQRFQSPNNMMLIKFSSYNVISASGFSAIYGNAKPMEAQQEVLIAYPTTSTYTVSQQQGNISSFVGMNDYLFVINAVNDVIGNIITLQINEMMIHNDDYIEVYDGERSFSPVLARLCNNGCNNYNVVFSTGTKMAILFRRMRSMDMNTRFSFSYTEGCSYSSSDRWGMFFSPGYPAGIEYTNFVKCTWLITPGEPITVFFDPDLTLIDEDFGQENNADYVEMKNNGVRLSQQTRGFNTTELAGNTFMIDSGILEVTFTSSPIRSGRGFKATWSIGCENPNYDDFTIRTPASSDYYTYKARTTLTCATGYTFQQEQIAMNTPSVTIECGYKGEWMTYKQIPRCTPVYCGDVPPIQNGYIQSSTGSVYNSVANYQCFPGLSLLGPQSITCNFNGNWSPQPVCQVSTCTPLSLNILNGQGSIMNGDGVQIGSIVQYSCNAGFEIVGEPIKFCQTDGTYSSTTVSCQRLTCRLPPIMKGFYPTETAGGFVDYEETVQVFCNGGYQYQNTSVSTVTCLDDRSVTQLPVCVDVDECSTQCQNNADCVNTDGSFSCTCREGYTGTGLVCFNLNECTTNNPCDQGCSDSIGSYTCSCNEPYVLFTNNMISGYEVPAGETGYLATDTFRYNHTCVLIECPAPEATIDNGMLLDKRDHHRYGDSIEYQCNVGYLPRSSVRMCQQNGMWSGIVPTCAPASCSTESLPGFFQNRAEVNNGPYNYGEQVYLNCTKAGQTFSNYRHCTYDPSTDSYVLQGSSYECGVVDCGAVDQQFSNTAISSVYPTNFIASCPINTAISGTGPDGTTANVICSADGQWEYGSLRCTGQSCTDPGFPAGGDIVATSFASGSSVSFTCSRAGYSLSSSISSLECQGSSWSPFISDQALVNGCIDTEDPVFSGDCGSTITLNRYELLAPRLPSITVSDNTGIAEFTISPLNANSTLYVSQPLEVEYTAFDYRRNRASCIVNVLIADEDPPSITCPSIRNVYLDTVSSEEDFILQQVDFVTTDNVDVQSFSFSSPLQKSRFTVADLYNTFTYTALVQDAASKTDTCRGQVFVSPRPSACVELGFQTPLNSNKECSSTINGLSCTITCDEQYTFENFGQRQRTVSCLNGVWQDQPIPACVLDQTKPDIACPSSVINRFREDTDERFVDFTILATQDSLYSVFDLNTIRSVTFSLDNKTFTTADIYQTTEVTLEVTDSAGNMASCEFQYTVLPDVCSPLSLPQPENAVANVCTRRNNLPGYDCTVTCNDGYVLRGVGRQTTVSCNDNQPWNQIYPSCVLDITSPTIVCPESRIITLESSSVSYDITFGDQNSPIQFIGTANDIGGIDRIEYNPPTRQINSLSLYQTSGSYQMTAYDRRGNFETCFFNILVEAEVCSDLSLPEPLNGAKNCTQNVNSGWTCTLTCDPGYTFATTTSNTIISTCNPGSTFNSFVPACVTGILSENKRFLGTLRYEYVSSSLVPNNCRDYYINQMNQPINGNSGDSLTLRMATRLEGLCLTAAFYNVNATFLSYDSSIGNGLSPIVTIDYTYQLTNANNTVYTRCSGFYKNLVEEQKFYYDLGVGIPGNGECPALTFNNNASQIRSDLYCVQPFYESLQDTSKCVLCPAGTESNGLVCSPCPIGTYRPGTSLGQCTACLGSGTTRYPGATSINDCTSPCTSQGRISSSGFEPCYNCDLGYYRVNNTFCQKCAPGTTTTIYGANSVESCLPITTQILEPCGLGTESDGSGGCTVCAEGSYKDINSNTCTSCQGTSSTYFTGAITQAACTGLCGFGLFSSDGRSPCRACPKGTYFQNSTYCRPCDQESTTEGVGATSVLQCVSIISLRVNCPRGTYRRALDGVCVNCEIGTFQDAEDQPSCRSCGAGKSTYFEGAVSFSQCFDTCAPGFRSTSGLSPCAPCGVGSYWVDSTTCEVCPNGGITVSNAAVSSSECRARCPAGQFSPTGYNLPNSLCRACPRNHYQENLQSTSCNQCGGNLYTAQGGQTSATQCVSTTPLCNCFNNGTCNFIFNTAMCQCQRGYYGSVCSQTVNYCSSNPCYNGGICSSTVEGHTCDCQGRATGSNCENIIDTCSTSSSFCSLNSYCINRPGSVQCLCKDGYTGDRCQTDTTICDAKPCNVTGTIFNGCSDVSFGENIRRKCSCKAGYEGEDCSTNINDCASTPCINGGSCRDLVNGFQCDCSNGYSGQYCQIRPNRCLGVNCGLGSMCVDDHQQESYHCVCLPGYAYGTYTHYSVQLSIAPGAVFSEGFCLDETLNVDACRQRCTDSVTCAHFAVQPTSGKCCLIRQDQAVGFVSFTANPYNLYTKMIMRPDDDFYTLKYNLNEPGNINSNNRDAESLNDFNNVYGLNICGGTQPIAAECCIAGGSCDSLPAGVACSTDGLTCNSFECQSMDFEIRFKCATQNVFLNNFCTQKNDFCASSPCVRGICSETFNGYTCQCPSGYSGLNCQTDNNECVSGVCQNNAECIDGLNQYTCNCKEGYEGFNCQSRVNYCSNINVCSGRGPCLNLETDFACTCNPGYEGKNCQDEVDRCRSNPCLQGSTCNRRFNDYTCDCVPGWFGKNCDQIVDNCNTFQGQQCLATCRNIFNDYYCECANNIFGMNCENQTNPCQDYNKCQNQALCSVAGDIMSCQCPIKYSGDGCQVLVNHCGLTNRCENGGTCMATDQGYSCSCPTGYNGNNCENNINECSNIVCPGGGTCYDAIGKFYCRCPLTKTGSSCGRDYNSDYDLYFSHPMAYAWIPYFIQVTNAPVLSFSLWIRYSVVGGEGLYMTQYIGDNLATSVKFMELDEGGVSVFGADANNRINERLTFLRGITINDGNWHLIAVTYDTTIGTMKLFSDTVFHSDVTNSNLILSDSDLRMWLILGCAFSKADQMCKGTDSFHGYLSQINWYKGLLNFQREIGIIFEEPRRWDVFTTPDPLSQMILVWNEYILEGGVDRLTPSQASGLECNSPSRTIPCSYFTATSLPTVMNCPDDIIQYSGDRLTQVAWNEPTFTGLATNGRYPTAFQPGNTFTWNIYDVVYMGRSMTNHHAYCNFRVYVQGNQCDLTANSPFSGRSPQCDSSNPLGRTGCRISCYDGTVIDRKTPDLFTCDSSGEWNYERRFQPFRFPSCGTITQASPKVRVVMKLTYNVGTSACTAVKQNLRELLRNQLVALSVIYKGEEPLTPRQLCSQDDCSDVNITIQCDLQVGGRRRKRQTPSLNQVTIEFLNADSTTKINGEDLTVAQFLTYQALGANVFNFTVSISNGFILEDLFSISVNVVCGPNEVELDGQCVECGSGNYFRYTDSTNTTAICDDCPLGSYQDMSGQSGCTLCTDGKTTEMTGNYEATACKDSCPVGNYFDNTADACRPCPIGFYQDEVGKFMCKGCEAGFTTEFVGTNSSTRCTGTCDSGQQLDGSGNCEPCPIGLYRNASETRQCVQCDAGLITATTGARSSALCNVTACEPGSKLNTITNLCEPCPEGSYQDLKWQTFCRSCGPAEEYLTNGEGKTSETDCIFYCSAGSEVSSPLTCSPCKVGFYKTGRLGQCLPCSGNYRTPGTGSTLPSECSIFKCPVGFAPNATDNGCSPCPLGQYQDVAESTSCNACSLGESTRETGSNSSLACEAYCPSGQEKEQSGCVACSQGEYKDNNDGFFSMCQSCGLVFTTVTTGSISAADCTVRACQPGTRRAADDQSCIACPVGTYQPLSFQTSCIDCQNGLSTRQENSTSQSDCETFCPDGSQKTDQGSCELCPVGYYKNNAADGVFSTCQLCPSVNITASSGSTQVSDCNIGNCTAGQLRNEDGICERCPKGSYQSEKWQDFCLPCGLDKTTEFDGSDNIADCILVCQPGNEDVNGICQPCPRGFYKVEEEASSCNPCIDSTTETTGADTPDLCTLPSCMAGTYLDRSGSTPVCMPCGYDTYQDEKWMESCKLCPNGGVTLKTGATMQTDCVLDCDSGQEYIPSVNGGSCDFCPIGYYRDKTVRVQTGCQLCDPQFITASVGSMSAASCVIANCTTPGYFRDSVANTCKPCPLGQYSNVKWRTFCEPCQDGYSTRSTGSVFPTACIPVCPLGQVVGTNNACVNCPIGSFKDSITAENCTKCPNDFQTPLPGSDSSNDCTISNCNAGSYYDLTNLRCTLCPIGTYQGLAGSFQCIGCENGFGYTASSGSNSQSACNSPCLAGRLYNNVTGICEYCPRGYYQDQANQFVCKECPAGLKYTAGTGSTTSDACVSYCDTSVNPCSLNATCTNTPTAAVCQCFGNYDDVGSTPGAECVHKCDRGYCQNNAVCIKLPQPRCQCTEYYEGDKCETAVRGDSLSDDTKDIVVPVAIGVGGLILFLIILAVCCLCYMNQKKAKKAKRPTQYSSFNGDRVDKVSVYSYDYGQTPYNGGATPRLMLAPNSEFQAPFTEIVYDNPGYLKAGDYGTEGSIDNAVYQA